MLIHLTPRIYSAFDIPISLVDFSIPEFNFSLDGQRDLVLRKPFPNKRIQVACRKKRLKAVNGFLISTEDTVSDFTAVTRWAIGADHVSTHMVRYELLDSQFDAYTEYMQLWYPTADSAGNWDSRWPKQYNDAPAYLQPHMDAFSPTHRGTEPRQGVIDQLDQSGEYVLFRKETFGLPSVQPDRIHHHLCAVRMPAAEDVFKVEQKHFGFQMIFAPSLLPTIG